MDYMIATRALVPTLRVGTCCSAALRPGERFPEVRGEARLGGRRASVNAFPRGAWEREEVTCPT